MAGSCARNKQGNTIVSGKISGSKGQLLKLQELGMQHSTTVDSILPGAEGNFSFRIFSKDAGLYILSLQERPPLVIELKPGDSVKVTAESASFPYGAVLKGSEISSDLLEFFNSTNAGRRIYDSLENVLLNYQEDPDFALLSLKLDESLKPLWESQRELEIAYIRSHMNSLTSLLVLNQGLGVNPVLTFNSDSVYFLRLDSSLNKAFPGNKHAAFHHQRIIQEGAVETMKQHSK
jgi:hypothetical protein